jgi:hypothetical protein
LVNFLKYSLILILASVAASPNEGVSNFKRRKYNLSMQGFVINSNTSTGTASPALATLVVGGSKVVAVVVDVVEVDDVDVVEVDVVEVDVVDVVDVDIVDVVDVDDVDVVVCSGGVVVDVDDVADVAVVVSFGVVVVDVDSVAAFKVEPKFCSPCNF